LIDSVPVADPRWLHVLFKGRRIEAYANPDGLICPVGSMVVVEAERGIDLGQVTCDPSRVGRRLREGEPRRVLRKATAEELEAWRALREADVSALAKVGERIRRFGVPMHPIDAEFQFDRNRVTFYFTAEHRVDFRDLVRDLAAIYHTRIELRQIGMREAARRLGGLGSCGREACCAVFLGDFERVTLQAARLAGGRLGPTKVSGLCGRLLCCLAFEGHCDREAGDCGREGGCPRQVPTE
jgi:cell fate regulator YaaT (PSP1 superfamily)